MSGFTNSTSLFDDIDISDKLFDELINELESDNIPSSIDLISAQPLPDPNVVHNNSQYTSVQQLYHQQTLDDRFISSNAAPNPAFMNCNNPALQYYCKNQNFNTVINEEVKKDEEEDLFSSAFTKDCKIRARLLYEQQMREQQQMIANHPAAAAPPSAESSLSVNTSHSNNNNNNNNSTPNEVVQQMQAQSPVPTDSFEPPLDEFAIGAMSVVSPELHHLQQHQQSNGNMAMHANHHKSNVKRKNSDISSVGSDGGGVTSSSSVTSGSSLSSSTNNNVNSSSIANSNGESSKNSVKPANKTSVVATASAIMTATASSSSTKSNGSNSSLLPANRMADFPIVLFQAFNEGDLKKVTQLIKDNSILHCGLKTPSLDREIFGQQYLIQFFQAMSDAHPDCVFVAKKCQLTDLAPVTLPPSLMLIPGLNTANSSNGQSKSEVNCRIYFAGTRIFKPQLPQFVDHNNYDYLFRRPGGSLLDEMDTDWIPVQEKTAMKELENIGKNLSIFGKGTMVFRLNQDNKITHMNIHWMITSFRETDIE